MLVLPFIAFENGLKTENLSVDLLNGIKHFFENFGQFELFALSDIFLRALIQYISLPEFHHLFFIFYYNFNIFTVHPHLTLQSLKKIILLLFLFKDFGQ